MTVPLIVLAVCSIGVAWGLPPWQAEESILGGHTGILQMSEPTATLSRMNLLAKMEHLYATEYHGRAELLAMSCGALGVLFAGLFYYWRVLDPAEAKVQFPGLYRLLWNKWYFDELYSVILVRPALVVAHWCRAFDARVIDPIVDNLGRATVKVSQWDGRFDLGIVDGLVNLTGAVVYACGAWLRRFQTGYIRSYVLFLVLAAIGIYLALSYFLTLAAAAP
jgi:NADH-quinone oxidoreductase subunit L